MSGPSRPKLCPDDPEQFQRFLEKAKDLGLDPTSETDLHRLDGVLRRVARLPTQREQPVKGEGPRGRRPRKSPWLFLTG
jgi:hypothetical protein